jgi:2-polyprenyl-3-methyl-5-hydroxy-6-metoxy-1,4-benzoquinol methylase
MIMKATDISRSFLFIHFLCISSISLSAGFVVTNVIPILHVGGDYLRRKVILNAGGFGSPKSQGSNNPTSKKMKESEKKKIQAQLLQKYGGDIAKGTEERIQASMSQLPPELYSAVRLYQKVKQWEARWLKLSELARNSIPEKDVIEARCDKEDLIDLYEKLNLDDADMHNFYQRTTWDASADAKSARAVMFRMNPDLERRIRVACEYLVDPVQTSGHRVLDVGCGPGILIPYLTNVGFLPKQIIGIDLSPEMIRNAQLQHRGVTFMDIDFIKKFHDDEGFNGIIFCSSLHDMPSQVQALQKARSLLRSGGTIVIVHAQGATHVLGQVKANPVMVTKGLPSALELEAMNLGLQIIQAPGEPGSKQDTENGYLAVLKHVP